MEQKEGLRKPALYGCRLGTVVLDLQLLVTQATTP